MDRFRNLSSDNTPLTPPPLAGGGRGEGVGAMGRVADRSDDGDFPLTLTLPRQGGGKCGCSGRSTSIRFRNEYSPARPIAARLLAALALAVLCGCATGGKVKTGEVPAAAVQEAKPAPAPTATTVARLTDGREGFVITEPSSMDAESLADFERAFALIKEAQYEKAIELLEKVIPKSPGVTAPHINIAIAYNRSGKVEQAEQHLKTALALVPDHPVASNEYGLLLRKAGRFAEGRTVFEKALAAFPEYHPIHRNLAILCDIYLKDWACAQKHFESYSKAVPKDEQVKLWLADLQARQGR